MRIFVKYFRKMIIFFSGQKMILCGRNTGRKMDAHFSKVFPEGITCLSKDEKEIDKKLLNSNNVIGKDPIVNLHKSTDIAVFTDLYYDSIYDKMQTWNSRKKRKQ